MNQVVFKKILISSSLLVSAFLLLWGVELNAAGQKKAQSSVIKQDSLKRVELKHGYDLEQVAKQASKKQVPIMLMFSMKHCPYCIEVEEDFLKPMLRNPEYKDKVVMRKIRLDGENLMHDFKGQLRDPDAFSDEYSISMVPTIILVDSNGKRMGKPIVGLSNPHYYGYELDKAIDNSLLQLRQVAKK